MKDPPDLGYKPPIRYDHSKKLSILSTGPKYLIMTRINSENTLANVSPFLIKKVIDSTCGGEVDMCKKLRNGTILVRTKSYTQANKLIQLCSLNHDIEIEMTEHNSLNFVRGVIYSNDLREIPEEEIQNELKRQNICKVNKIMRKVNNELKETGLIIVTFGSTTLPSEILIGYESVRVRPYIPLPLKCKNCLRFGHHFNNCNNKKLCTSCSKEFHIDLENNETCEELLSCINCIENNKENSNHSPNNKTCPVFLKEKEIQAIITLEKVNRKTAVTKYNERNISTSSYANAAKTTTTTNTKSTTPNNNQQIENNKALQKIDNNKTSSTKTMPPPTSSTSTRNLKDYSDITTDIDSSDADTTSNSSQASTVKGAKKVEILPTNTTKRTRQLLKKQAEAAAAAKRQKNN